MKKWTLRNSVYHSKMDLSSRIEVAQVHGAEAQRQVKEDTSRLPEPLIRGNGLERPISAYPLEAPDYLPPAPKKPRLNYQYMSPVSLETVSLTKMSLLTLTSLSSPLLFQTNSLWLRSPIFSIFHLNWRYCLYNFNTNNNNFQCWYLSFRWLQDSIVKETVKTRYLPTLSFQVNT